MTAVVVVGDTVRCPELRHEVPLDVMDTFVLVEVGGRRHVFVAALEAGRLEALGPGLVVHRLEEIGWDEIRLRGGHPLYAECEATVRACRLLGVGAAVVPGAFPVAHADALRRAGVAVEVDQGVFDDRRRLKTPAELAGIRRAQAAIEDAFGRATALLRAADATGHLLVLEGVPLTVERVKEEIHAAFAAHGAVADDIVVAPGTQSAGGHLMGAGPIAPGVPIVIDLWPRDRISGCFSDMTRTVCVGAPDPVVAEWHRLACEALAVASALVVPGRSCRDLYAAACEVFEGAGLPTQRVKETGVPLDRGFTHALGHGLGLQVHEAPYLGADYPGELREGDVIALEPGLYDPAVGGVRVEDVLLVTRTGAELLTFLPYDLVL